MKRKPVIETSSLSIGYVSGRKKKHVVHDSLNLQLFPGELTGLLGLNGAGKSTLIRTLCGFQPLLNGRIRLMDKDLSDYSQGQLARIAGVVLTEKTNAGGISVYELISLGRHPYTGFLGQLKSKDHQIIEESMEAVGISHKADCYVSELSDGERQKTMIAKVLTQQCPVILLDEPTAFLDITSRIEIMTLLRRLAIEQQKAILLSTHDLDLAIRTIDCLWLQAKGRQMICGTPEDLILNGDFETFFSKDGIVFDRATGKLTTDMPFNPIGVDGESVTVHWVSNALIRNGYLPSPVNKEYTTIYCADRNNLQIMRRNGTVTTVNNVFELISKIRNKTTEHVE
jgi:iron complex transport system ATP-binding protein